MTVVELVERERARVRAAYVAAGAALTVAVALAIVAVGAFALGEARWIAAPRGAPLVVWVAIGAVVAAAVWLTRRAVLRHATRGAVAAAIEREQRLRAGALRGTLEVAASGPLAARAAADLSSRLAAGGPLAPAHRRRARSSLAVGAAAAVLAVGAAMRYQHTRREAGTLHPVLFPSDAP
jgi:hypothetical protein